ncbi:MAG: pitrilysin family protein [Armatimonadota bacterium]|nr:pitrilysin family protein [Armatimonadota bacterium]MDR7519799.1 pitrilysin family protein [Armatimonadota bacterium]MDR7549564.1 pitrilysin family protein [Armatimonadota bacterium]
MQEVLASTLPNGLRVLIQESHTAPVATFWMWYRVGSRNEMPGLTGISHWVEHLLFKGTPRHPAGMLTRLIDRLGGRWNAFTWKDYTAYFEVLPAEHLETAIRLEADRMQNTVFDPEVVASERTVIISEREGAENFPSYLLGEEVEALAFKVHPYRHPVIGWKEDLRAITHDDLYRHYRTHYHPNNAVALAVGDFEPEDVLRMIEEAFGPIPPGDPPPPVRSVEPEQSGERRVTLRRPGGGTAYFHLAFHAPPAAHPDLPALMVTDGLLTGFKGVASFNGAGSGRSSRLYRALVDGGLAATVGSAITPSIDPTLFRITATVRSGVEVAAVEAAVTAEIARLHDEPVEESELARVRRQARAQFVYLRDGVFPLARALGALAVVDRPEALPALADAIERTTGEDVARVARTYLTDRRRTVGWYVPDDSRPGQAWGRRCATGEGAA